MAIGDRIGEFVGIGRDALFKMEEAVGVAVGFIARRGGETDEEGIEVVEDGSVALIDGAVGFVNDDEIEITWTEAALAVARFVDEAERGGIGADVDAAVFVDPAVRSVRGLVW
jgi:hypothetical protein